MNPNPNPDISPIDHFLTGLKTTTFFKDEQTEGSLAQQIRYYKVRAPGRMRGFRFTGLVVILFSTTLPIVAAYSNVLPGKNIWVSLMAVVVALATAINAFFRWDIAWQGFVNTQITLEHLRSRWELAIADARSDPDPQKGLELAQQATQDLVAKALDVIEAETKGYFSVQRFPDSRAKSTD